MQDGTPMIVEWFGSREYTYFDEHLQRDNQASESFVGVRFVIDPLPDGTVNITAECLHPVFLPLFAELMAELGQQLTDDAPAIDAVKSPDQDALLQSSLQTNEQALPMLSDDQKHWADIFRQAKESGNVKKYLVDKEIPKSTFYDKVKQYGLK